MKIEEINYAALPTPIREYSHSALSHFTNAGEVLLIKSFSNQLNHYGWHERLYFVSSEADNKLGYRVYGNEWKKILDIYSETFLKGYRTAEDKLRTFDLKGEEWTQTIFAGVFRKEIDFENVPLLIEDDCLTVDELKMSDYAFRLGIYTKYWDVILLNPIHFETVFTKFCTEADLQSASVSKHFEKMELVELGIALIENGNLRGTRKDVFRFLSKVFNVEITHIDKYTSDLHKRKNGGETKYLDTLKQRFLKWLSK